MGGEDQRRCPTTRPTLLSGATAFLRALEAWRDAATGERGPRAAVVENL